MMKENIVVNIKMLGIIVDKSNDKKTARSFLSSKFSTKITDVFLTAKSFSAKNCLLNFLNIF